MVRLSGFKLKTPILKSVEEEAPKKAEAPKKKSADKKGRKPIITIFDLRAKKPQYGSILKGFNVPNGYSLVIATDSTNKTLQSNEYSGGSYTYQQVANGEIEGWQLVPNQSYGEDPFAAITAQQEAYAKQQKEAKDNYNPADFAQLPWDQDAADFQDLLDQTGADPNDIYDPQDMTAMIKNQVQAAGSNILSPQGNDPESAPAASMMGYLNGTEFTSNAAPYEALANIVHKNDTLIEMAEDAPHLLEAMLQEYKDAAFFGSLSSLDKDIQEFGDAAMFCSYIAARGTMEMDEILDNLTNSKDFNEILDDFVNVATKMRDFIKPISENTGSVYEDSHKVLKILDKYQDTFIPEFMLTREDAASAMLLLPDKVLSTLFATPLMVKEAMDDVTNDMSPERLSAMLKELYASFTTNNEEGKFLSALEKAIPTLNTSGMEAVEILEAVAENTIDNPNPDKVTKAITEALMGMRNGFITIQALLHPDLLDELKDAMEENNTDMNSPHIPFKDAFMDGASFKAKYEDFFTRSKEMFDKDAGKLTGGTVDRVDPAEVVKQLTDRIPHSIIETIKETAKYDPSIFKGLKDVDDFIKSLPQSIQQMLDVKTLDYSYAFLDEDWLTERNKSLDDIPKYTIQGMSPAQSRMLHILKSISPKALDHLLDPQHSFELKSNDGGQTFQDYVNQTTEDVIHEVHGAEGLKKMKDMVWGWTSGPKGSMSAIGMAMKYHMASMYAPSSRDPEKEWGLSQRKKEWDDYAGRPQPADYDQIKQHVAEIGPVLDTLHELTKVFHLATITDENRGQADGSKVLYRGAFFEDGHDILIQHNDEPAFIKDATPSLSTLSSFSYARHVAQNFAEGNMDSVATMVINAEVGAEHAGIDCRLFNSRSHLVSFGGMKGKSMAVGRPTYNDFASEAELITMSPHVTPLRNAPNEMRQRGKYRNMGADSLDLDIHVTLAAGVV